MTVRKIVLFTANKTGGMRVVCLESKGKDMNMNEDARKERIAELKWRMFEEIPGGAFFTPEQELIVKGLLFDAVDEAVQLAERMRVGA